MVSWATPMPHLSLRAKPGAVQRRLGARWSYESAAWPVGRTREGRLPSRRTQVRTVRTVRYYVTTRCGLPQPPPVLPLLHRLRLRSTNGDSVALHARVQRAPRDAEQGRRLGLVSLRALQRFADETLLDLVEAQSQREQLAWIGGEACLSDREMQALDRSGSGENARPLDQVLELADVAGKLVVPEMLERVGRDVGDGALLYP